MDISYIVISYHGCLLDLFFFLIILAMAMAMGCEKREAKTRGNEIDIRVFTYSE